MLLKFFEGYGERPLATEHEYGPFNFVDLVHMDILNVLRSYTKRYAKGDMKYSLSSALGSEEFCINTEHLIDHEEID